MAIEKMTIRLAAVRVFNRTLLQCVRAIPKTTWAKLPRLAFTTLAFLNDFDLRLLQRCQALRDFQKEIRLQTIRCDVLKFAVTVLLEGSSYGELWVNCSWGSELIVAFTPREVFTGLDGAAMKKLMAAG